MLSVLGVLSVLAVLRLLGSLSLLSFFLSSLLFSSVLFLLPSGLLVCWAVRGVLRLLGSLSLLSVFLSPFILSSFFCFLTFALLLFWVVGLAWRVGRVGRAGGRVVLVGAAKQIVFVFCDAASPP